MKVAGTGFSVVREGNWTQREKKGGVSRKGGGNASSLNGNGGERG